MISFSDAEEIAISTAQELAKILLDGVSIFNEELSQLIKILLSLTYLPSSIFT